MQISTQKLPKSVVELTITLTEAELAVGRTAAVKEISEHVKLPGFRPGHVPEGKIVERVGEEVVRAETVSHAARAAAAKAIVEADLKPVAQPAIKIESETEPVKFTVTVPVFPEITLGDYLKIQLKKESTEVTEKEVTEFTAEFLKHQATAQKVDRAAQKGDRVEIDFAGCTPDGVPLDGTSSKHHPLTLGSGNFIPGFEDGLVGAAAGDEKTLDITFPTDYHAAHLAGKPVQFQVKVHEVCEMQVPAGDDALAEKLKPGAKWSELQTDFRTHLAQQKTQAADRKIEKDLVDELLKVCAVEPPEALVHTEVHHLLEELKERISRGGLTFEKYCEGQKKTAKEIHDELHPEAEKRVKVRLILGELINAEKIEVSDDEVAAEIEKAKASYGSAEAQKLTAAYQPGSGEYFRLKYQLKVLKLLAGLTAKLSQ